MLYQAEFTRLRVTIPKADTSQSDLSYTINSGILFFDAETVFNLVKPFSSRLQDLQIATASTGLLGAIKSLGADYAKAARAIGLPKALPSNLLIGPSSLAEITPLMSGSTAPVSVTINNVPKSLQNYYQVLGALNAAKDVKNDLSARDFLQSLGGLKFPLSEEVQQVTVTTSQFTLPLGLYSSGDSLAQLSQLRVEPVLDFGLEKLIECCVPARLSSGERDFNAVKNIITNLGLPDSALLLQYGLRILNEVIQRNPQFIPDFSSEPDQFAASLAKWTVVLTDETFNTLWPFLNSPTKKRLGTGIFMRSIVTLYQYNSDSKMPAAWKFLPSTSLNSNNIQLIDAITAKNSVFNQLPTNYFDFKTFTTGVCTVRSLGFINTVV